MTDLFSPKAHNTLLSQVERTYHEFIEDIRDDLDEGYQTTFLSASFLREFKSLLTSSELEDYSPLHFYWAQSIDQLIQIVQLHEELEECVKSQNNDEVEELKDEIFQFWDEHEHSHLFVEIFQKGKDAPTASLELIPLLENQILGFYKIHIGQEPFLSDSPLIYQAIAEKGEGDIGLHIGIKNQTCPMDVHGLNGLISFSRIDHIQKILEIQVSEEKIFNVSFEQPPYKIKYENVTLDYLPICTKGLEQAQEQTKRIQKALERIHLFSPECFCTLKSFTHSIVPVNEPGIVSYSVQALPGYSSINLFERDDIDLLDDLVHENGHHYLNTILNHEELINEDPDQIYYSPWRRALRPVRGIYHAYFTFYWALKLFADIAEHSGFEETFNSQQKAKILLRVLEEYEMLKFSEHVLLQIDNDQKILPHGIELMNEVKKAIAFYDSRYKDLYHKLERTDHKKLQELNELKEHLTKMKQQYQL